MSVDDETDVAVEKLIENVEKTGVGTAAVSDGRIFMFSAKKLRELLAVAEKDVHKQHVMLFIQNEMDVTKEGSTN